MPRGAQRQAILLAREWQRAGHDVRIYTSELARPYAFDDLLAELQKVVVTEPWTTHLRHGGTLPGSNLVRLAHTHNVLKRLAHHLEKDGIDVIHAHNHPAQWIAASTQIPVVWTCNEPPYWHYYPTLRNKLSDPAAQFYDAKVGKRLHEILVLDSRMAKMVGDAYPHTRIRIVGSGCELPGRLPSRGAAPALGVPSVEADRWNVLTVIGGLYPQKRPLDAVDAVAASGVSGATLHLVGQDLSGMQEVLRKRALDQGVDLRWHPTVSEEHLLYLYANADAALFIPENQPWGIFPLEALLAGVPVVLSDEVGVREVLPENYPYVVRTGDTQAAGRVLSELQKSTSFKHDTVKSAAALVREKYSWTACAARVLDALQSAV